MIKIKAKKALNFPQSNSSGVMTNSKMFILAMITICTTALNFEYLLDRIQNAIAISRHPIVIIRGLE